MHVFPSKRRNRGSVRAGFTVSVAPIGGSPAQAIVLPGFPRRCGFRPAAALASGMMTAERARPVCEFKQERLFVMWIVEAVASQ
jgi:hypothetical protein